MYYSLGKSKYLLQNKFKDKANAWENSLQIVKYFRDDTLLKYAIFVNKSHIPESLKNQPFVFL